MDLLFDSQFLTWLCAFPYMFPCDSKISKETKLTKYKAMNREIYLVNEDKPLKMKFKPNITLIIILPSTWLFCRNGRLYGHEYSQLYPREEHLLPAGLLTFITREVRVAGVTGRFDAHSWTRMQNFTKTRKRDFS